MICWAVLFVVFVLFCFGKKEPIQWFVYACTCLEFCLRYVIYIPMWMSCTRNDCFLLRVHTPNKFIYCSCKVHNNYAIMNLTVIPYILIIFLWFFFFFKRPDADIFFWGGSYSFSCFIICVVCLVQLVITIYVFQ